MSEPSSSESSIGLGTKKTTAEQVVARLVSLYAESSEHPMMVAVGGPGGVGKSTFCQALTALVPDSMVIPLDDYRLPRKKRQASGVLGSHPDANDIETIRHHIQLLRKGNTVDKPVYDPVKGEVSGVETKESSRIIILDGEVSTYDCLKDLIDLSIYMDADWRTQLESRLSRDIGSHKFSPEKALRTFLQSNCTDAREFGQSGKNRADINVFARADYGVVIEAVKPEFQELLGKPEPLTETDFRGLVVPVTTPFSADLTIDEAAFIRHLEWLESCGVERVLVGGTLGEFFSLSHDECRRLLRLARRHFSGVIFFQAGRENRVRTLEEIRMAEDNGADSLLILTPYFYADVGEKGLIEYFSSVVDAVNVPLILYNFTRHTQNTLTGPVLSAIQHFGLKDSDANLDLLPFTPRYYLGADTGMVAAYAAGSFGFVSGSANFLPEEYVALERDLKSGGGNAQQLQDIVDRAVAKSSGINSIVRIKAMLSQCVSGYPNYTRPPL